MSKAYVVLISAKRKHKLNVQDIGKLSAVNKRKTPPIPSNWAEQQSSSSVMGLLRFSLSQLNFLPQQGLKTLLITLLFIFPQIFTTILFHQIYIRLTNIDISSNPGKKALIIIWFKSMKLISFKADCIQVTFLMRSKQKESRSISNKKAGDSLLNRKIIAPQKLKILVLAGNDLASEHLDFLEKCINLIKLDLSHNHIIKIHPNLDLSHLQHLQVTFLHHNKLSSVESISPLYQCKALTFLTYHHNPLENIVRHQHQIVNFLPNLKLINNRIVFLEERSDFMFPQRLPVFADMETLENWKSTQNSEAYYLKVLNMQLQYIDNLWAFNNPVIIIQRAWKHFLPQYILPLPSSRAANSRPSRNQRGISRNKASSKNESVSTPHPLRDWFLQWKSFADNFKFVRWSMQKVDKSYMLYPLSQYKTELRNMRVNKPLIDFLAKIRRKIYQRKMAKKLMANIKLKQTLFQSEFSFYHVSGIQENNRFYYNRSQKHILENFLILIGEKFSKKEVVANECRNQIAKQFNAIRLVDPQSFTNKYNGNKYNSLCSLVWPSMKVVVAPRKVIASQFKAGIIGIPQLTYIRNRDKVLTKSQFSKSVETFQRLQKFAKNQYESSLYYFQCKDEFVMKQLTRMIYYHNSKAVHFQVKGKRNQMMSLLQNFEEPFIFYVDNVIKRTVAAVTIQKTWRRYISNKNQAQSIYHKMKKNRAALHIQRFFRDSIYRHRLHFHKKLSRDLSNLKTNTIIYPLSFYMNLNDIFRYPYETSLFSRVRLTRGGHIIGLMAQFFKPIFQEKIRENYYKGQRLGTENHPNQIDLYNLFHFNVSVSILFRNDTYFISFTYASETQTNITASIIALLSYQLWGSYYVWPLTKQTLGQWESRISEYRLVKTVKPFVSQFKQEPFDLIPLEKKPVKEHGLFVWKNQTKLHTNWQDSQMGTKEINVQFYQKRYHNYPIKQITKINYTLINEVVEEEKEEITESESEIPKGQTEPLRISNPPGPLNITTIDKRRFSLFDQSEKTMKQPEPDPIVTMGNTQGLSEQGKKDKVMKFYQQQYLKKQAQKELKESTLAGVREKAKKERVLNSTLRSLKEAERTEALRSRVQKVKDFKNRSVPKKEEEEFVQQNNFVMKQQLKMMIMRSKMKETEEKKEDFLNKKSSLQRHSEILAQSIPSRKSSRQKQRSRMEMEDLIAENSQSQTQALGEQGSIVNTKKRTKRSRAHSIGAYMRDPSFVHGVFPEEYYPIESRATAFYFPPVV